MREQPKVTIGRKLRSGHYQLHCIVSCGKCCEGGLKIPIRVHEKKRYKLKNGLYGRAVKVQLDIQGRESDVGEWFYELATKSDGSCWYLKDQRCSIYHRRPEACRGYVCNRLRAEALKLVEG